MRLWPKKRWQRVLSVVLGLVIVPYLFSRLASPYRSIMTSTDPDAQPRSTQRSSLRIISYNIAHGRGVAESNFDGGTRAERLERLDQIAKLLRSIDADVVVLNEVDFDSSWSHSVNQARYLAERADYPYRVEQRNLDFRVLFWTCRFGNAILSKHPIEEAQRVDLPGYSAWETIFVGKKRGIDCKITTGIGTVRLIGVHLSHRSEPLRVRSADAIEKQIAESRVPVFIAGDLNSAPPGFPDSTTDSAGRNAISIFDASQRVHRFPIEPPESQDDWTFPSTNPRSLIDWILIPSDWALESYHIERSLLSDHRPVIVESSPTGKSPRPEEAIPTEMLRRRGDP